MRRRRDALLPLLIRDAYGGGEDGAHEPAARTLLQVRREHLACAREALPCKFIARLCAFGAQLVSKMVRSQPASF